METFGKLILGSIASFFSYIWCGYVLSVLWGWFIVTTFGLLALNIPSAIGLIIVVGFTTYQYYPLSEETKWLEICFLSAFRPLLALFAGWIIHLFM